MVILYYHCHCHWCLLLLLHLLLFGFNVFLNKKVYNSSKGFFLFSAHFPTGNNPTFIIDVKRAVVDALQVATAVCYQR